MVHCPIGIFLVYTQYLKYFVILFGILNEVFSDSTGLLWNILLYKLVVVQREYYFCLQTFLSIYPQW